MKKPNEERLSDIENGISRLIKMQDRMFNVLLILDKTTSLIDRAEQVASSFEIPLYTVTHTVNTSIVFMFGALTMIGLSVALSSLHITTQELAFKVVAIVIGIFALALGIYAILQYRSASSQIQGIKKKATQTEEVFDRFKKESAALDDALAQALAKWKELVPDDSVSEPKSED